MENERVILRKPPLFSEQWIQFLKKGSEEREEKWKKIKNEKVRDMFHIMILK